MANDPWRRLRVHRWILFGGWLGWLPYGILIMNLRRATGVAALPPIMMASYALAWLANGIALGFMPCPRCGRRFSSRKDFGNRYAKGYSNAFTRRCLNCGQRAYQPLDPAPVETVPFRPW